MCTLHTLFFSTREALKGAEERQKELEQEVERVTQQIKEEMNIVIHQKEEEIERLQEVLDEHQERQLAEAKAREENARYASNLLRICVETTVTFLLFYISLFLDLIGYCWRCRITLHKKVRS